MISDEQPPLETEARLAEYLARQFRSAKYDIEQLIRVVLQLVPAGYGGGIQDIDVPNYDIPTVTYVTVPFDALLPINQRGVVFDIPTETYTFTASGVWTLMFNFNLVGHDSSNSGRSFYARVYDVTNTLAVAGVDIGSGRNQEDTFISVSLMIEISQDDVNNSTVFRLEVGNANIAIIGGTLTVSMIQFSHVSELRTLL